jgi:exopolysaccharide production protein ExoQ
MNAPRNRDQLARPAPYMSLAAPWLLQGVLLLCVTRGFPPFLGGSSSDGITESGGIISGTALYLLQVSVWCLTIFNLMKATRSLGVFSRNRVVLLSLPIYALVSVLWSTAPKLTLGDSFELILLTLVGMHLGSELSPARQMQLMILTGVLATLSSLVLVGIAPTEALDHYGHVGAVKGIFTHKNSCGIDMVFLATPGLFLLRTARAHRVAVYAYVTLCGMMVFLSQSRTAWIYFAFIVTVATVSSLLRKFHARDSVVIAAVLIVLACVASLGVIANFALITEAIGKDDTLSGRTMIWQSVFGAIMKRPILGYGYEAFFSQKGDNARNLAMTTGFYVNHPHNGYLSVWLDLGAVGLAIVLVTILNAFRDLKRVWRSKPHTDWYLCLIILSLVLAFSETTLAGVNDISWLLFVMSCTGLYTANRSCRPAISGLRQNVHLVPEAF